MNELSFFEKIKTEVRDPALRDRLLEELNDHLEDAQTKNSETSEKIFGEAKIIAAQTNSLKGKNFLLADISLALVVGLITFIFLIGLSSLFSLVTEQNRPILGLITCLFGLIIYSSAIFIFYLAVLKRFFIHFGQSTSRTVLLFLAFYFPWALGTIEGLQPAFFSLNSEMPLSLRLEAFLVLIPAVLLLKLFKTGDRWIIKNDHRLNFWLGKILKKLHFIIAPLVVFVILILTNNWDSGDSPLSFILMPLYLPFFVAYLFWGLSCSLTGLIFTFINLPTILGFWLNTLFIIVLTIILPIGQIIWRRKAGALQKIILAIFLPLFIMIPFVPHDIPKPVWYTPVVWSWEDLEKQQLNIAFPWAAALMRRDDGMNVSYEATASEKSLEVLQLGGSAINFLRGQSPTIKQMVSTSKNDNYQLTGINLKDFSCNNPEANVTLDKMIQPPEQNTSPLGMFGTECLQLAYKNQPIVDILPGGLIDLDLTTDGLLAIGISMGSYDPTYVYVTDISELMK
ncbi:MAG: hypothetical protein V1664_02490 [Candidatus Uhrbacteria bacterium]